MFQTLLKYMTIIFMFLPISACAVDSDGNNIQAGDLQIVLDPTTGIVVNLFDTSKTPRSEHNVTAAPATLFSLIVEPTPTSEVSQDGAGYYQPVVWFYTSQAPGIGEIARGTYLFNFEDQISVNIELVEQQAGYATLEVVAIANPLNKDIRNVVWGPLTTDIIEKVGDQLGVVSNRDFALGMFGLNAKTTGGWPGEYNHLGYHSQLVGIAGEWGHNARFWFEISAARQTAFGSILQAYTRDFSVDRIYNPWDFLNFAGKVRVPALTGANADYGSLIGSKVALFGIARTQEPTNLLRARDIIAKDVKNLVGSIQLKEGMPHPIVADVWAKKSEKANAPYLIFSDLSASNLSTAVSWAQDIGFEHIYRNTGWGFFNGGGTYTINSAFGSSDASLQTALTNTHNNDHIGIGSHTLSSWVHHTNAVSVANRAGLSFKASGNLKTALSSSGNALTIAATAQQSLGDLQTAFNNPGGDNFLLIDNEILTYTGTAVSGSDLQLTGLTRGIHSSSAAAHNAGAEVRRLWHYSYGSDYNAGFDMALNTIAPRIADAIDLGIRDYSFDGAEAMLLGHDAVGLSAFTAKVYQELTDKHDFVHDQSVATSYNWHLNSRYNWGETADDITTAHQRYRWNNQIYFDRNFQNRALGWWNIDNGNEWRWAMAKAASFNAGFAYFGNVNDAFRYSAGLRAEIKDWSNADYAGAFDEATQLSMRKRDQYFKLDKSQFAGAFGPTWKLSDWAISGTENGTRSNTRSIAPQMAGFPRVNLARDANVLVSSMRDTGFNGGLAVDRHTGVGIPYATFWPNIEGGGEWIAHSTDSAPWIELSWDGAQKVRQIILFDRETPNDNITSATLSFSDGSTLAVSALPVDGKPRIVNFPEKLVQWVRLTINSHIGSKPGLGEFVVLGPNPDFNAHTLASGATVTGTLAGQGTRVTDGLIASEASNVAELTGTSATLDLGGQYYIGGLSVWRNFSDGRTYNNVVFEIAQVSDFSNSTIVFNNDAANFHGLGVGADAQYAETSAGKLVKFAPVPGRYIRIWSNGNTVNAGNHLTEIEVYGVGNATTGATSVTTSNGAAINQANAIDHDLTSPMADIGAGPQYLQIDLGSSKSVNSLVVMRDYLDMRTYNNVVYQLSNSPTFATGVTTVFHNDNANVHGLGLGESTDSQYQETENGRYVTFQPVNARYVRLYSNGSNHDANNRYREILIGTLEPG